VRKVEENHDLRRVVNARSLEADQRGLEESLRCSEPAQRLVDLMETNSTRLPFVANSNNLTVGKFVALFEC
jgi:hypothetical protein